MRRQPPYRTRAQQRRREDRLETFVVILLCFVAGLALDLAVWWAYAPAGN